MNGFTLRAHQKIRGRRSDHSHRGVLCAFALAILIAPAVTALMDAPAFAEISPEFSNAAASAKVDDSPIQLAQGNLPPIGSVDDYMREGNENGGMPGAGAPPQAYQPQPMPQQGFSPQGVPSQEWNYRNADPNAERSALIGVAVVGALAVGLWALQQHAMRQAQRRARKRFYPQQRAYANQIE